MAEPIDPALLAFAEEARRIEPRVRATSFRPGDSRTVLLIEILDVPREVTKRLYDRLRTYRDVNGVACDVLIMNTSTPHFVTKPEIPSGWPP